MVATPRRPRGEEPPVDPPRSPSPRREDAAGPELHLFIPNTGRKVTRCDEATKQILEEAGVGFHEMHPGHLPHRIVSPLADEIFTIAFLYFAFHIVDLREDYSGDGLCPVTDEIKGFLWRWSPGVHMWYATKLGALCSTETLAFAFFIDLYVRGVLHPTDSFLLLASSAISLWFLTTTLRWAVSWFAYLFAVFKTVCDEVDEVLSHISFLRPVARGVEVVNFVSNLLWCLIGGVSLHEMDCPPRLRGQGRTKTKVDWYYMRYNSVIGTGFRSMCIAVLTVRALLMIDIFNTRVFLQRYLALIPGLDVEAHMKVAKQIHAGVFEQLLPQNLLFSAPLYLLIAWGALKSLEVRVLAIQSWVLKRAGSE